MLTLPPRVYAVCFAAVAVIVLIFALAYWLDKSNRYPGY